eukprot:117313_1
MSKYGNYISNTDFIWYYHDYKGYNYMNKFIINNSIPYIWCDHNMARTNGPLGNIFLLSISRGWLKYRYLVDIYHHKNYKHLKLRNAENKYRIIDYYHFTKLLNRYELISKLKWENKEINKAMFRGWKGNGKGIRNNLIYILNNISFFNSFISNKYFDVLNTKPFGLLSRSNATLTIREQINYRYIIVMDGVTVRDSLIYQMLYGSIILKQLSTMHEYFYWE